MKNGGEYMYLGLFNIMVDVDFVFPPASDLSLIKLENRLIFLQSTGEK